MILLGRDNPKIKLAVSLKLKKNRDKNQHGREIDCPHVQGKPDESPNAATDDDGGDEEVQDGFDGAFDRRGAAEGHEKPELAGRYHQFVKITDGWFVPRLEKVVEYFLD